MKMKIFFLLGLLLFSFGTFSFVSAQEEAYAGLVPCGRNYADIDVGAAGSAVGNPCTLCHLFSGIKNIIDWGLRILAFLALVCLAIAGVMYVVSAGDESMITNAKTFIKNVLIGVVIVLLAWFIVSVIIMYLAKADMHSVWSGIACDDVSRSTTQNQNSDSNPDPIDPTPIIDEAAELSISPQELRFGDVKGNTVSGSQLVTLTSTATLCSTTLEDVELVGADKDSFQIDSNSCGASLSAGSSCAVSVKFAPTECRAHNASLKLKYKKMVSITCQDSGSASRTIPLSGTGIDCVDRNTVSFDLTSAVQGGLRFNEGAGTVTLTLKRDVGTGSHPHAGPLDVTLTTQNRTAQSTDYSLLNQTVSWLDGDTEDKSVVLVIHDNDRQTGPLDFSISISTSDPHVQVGSHAVIFIEDNDLSTIGFETSTLLADEGTSPTAQLNRTGGSAGRVVARVTAGGGTATANDDYIFPPREIVWENGDEAPKEIWVSIIADRTPEPAETFNLNVEIIEGDSFAQLGTSTLTVTINE